MHTCGNCSQFEPLYECEYKRLGEPAMGQCVDLEIIVYASDTPMKHRCQDLPEDRM